MLLLPFQASEKALKAALYAVHSPGRYGHNLPSLAAELNEEIQNLAAGLQQHLGDHARMRYPDVCYGKIPHDLYSKADATKAVQLTTDLISAVKTYIVSNT